MADRDQIEQARRDAKVRAAQDLRQGGAQLALFGQDGAAVAPEARKGPGRPAGAKNKLTQKLAQLMATRGYRDPAEQLAMLAGLDRPDLHPLALAGELAELVEADPLAVLAQMRQAAADLMPYWHGKVTPDQAQQPPTQIVAVPVPTWAADRPAELRDITPGARRIAPPPLPHEIQQNQGLAEAETRPSDAANRTDGAND